MRSGRPDITGPLAPPSPWIAYRLRWKRRRLLWRAWRSRHDLKLLQDNTQSIRPDDIILVTVMRNEALRLPGFLEHYRKLGVAQFLIVDHQSTDTTRDLMTGAEDVSIWSSAGDYRQSRFGLDWVNWLLMTYAHQRWVIVADADELLVFDGHPDRDVRSLTALLDRANQPAFGALMLDLYPKGAIGDPSHSADHFDPGPYRARRQAPLHNLWVQGGARERVFFAQTPERSPTLNKLPLVRWNRRWAFVNSTHSALPWWVNHWYEGPGDQRPSGVLLHTKFQGDVTARAKEDIERRQHFHDPDLFAGYYRDVLQEPDMSDAQSVRYEALGQLVRAGLMPRLDWDA